MWARDMKSANAAGEMAPTDSMQGCRRPPVGENCNVWSSLGAQQAKDLVVSLEWVGSLLWRRFNPWNFHVPAAQPKKNSVKWVNSRLWLPSCMYSSYFHSQKVPLEIWMKTYFTRHLQRTPPCSTGGYMIPKEGNFGCFSNWTHLVLQSPSLELFVTL